MDQERLLIAIVLSVLVFTVWGIFFQDKTPPPKLPVQSQSESMQSSGSSDAASSQNSNGAADTSIHEQTLLPFQPHKDIVVNTPLYSLTISDKGAVFKSFVLKKYRESIDLDSPYKELITSQNAYGSVHLSLVDNSIPELQDAVFLSSNDSEHLDILDKSQDISFLWTSPSGMTVEKQFSFNPNSYLIGMKIILKNGSTIPFQDSLMLSLSNKFADAKAGYGFVGPSALINNSLEQIAIKDIHKKDFFAGKIDWICIGDRYFLSSIIPSPTVDASIKLSYANERLDNNFIQQIIPINPGSQRDFQYNIYMGPKSYSVLRSLNIGLDKAIHFGFFDFIAKPLLMILNMLYGIIPNYGLAIIVLTLLIKAVLWPLGSKSYRSMSDMKKIQPLMAQIREKYKDDKKKMNEETMALYKTYKVNPLGGCLPMVVQIPVFFALYRMLYEAIELRHAPFFGWINDLSSPDRLLHFTFSVPFMQPPYGIPVLTIIMGATMFLQQKMSPPMGDPAQAKMMMMMPVVFTFIFINFSSGLVLYWLVNNIVSISQQYYIQKKYA